MRDEHPASGSDEDLMMHYARGDLEAFHSLYNRHRTRLYRYLLCQTNPGMAGELFQGVWARLIESRGCYRPGAVFSIWLYTLARNRLIDYRRAQGRLPEPDSWMGDDALPLESGTRAGPAHPVSPRDCIAYLRELVEALPDALRETFLLRHEAGLSLAQIAQAMKTGTGTAEGRLCHAMDRLRAALPEECFKES